MASHWEYRRRRSTIDMVEGGGNMLFVWNEDREDGVPRLTEEQLRNYVEYMRSNNRVIHVTTTEALCQMSSVCKRKGSVP